MFNQYTNAVVNVSFNDTLVKPNEDKKELYTAYRVVGSDETRTWPVEEYFTNKVLAERYATHVNMYGGWVDIEEKLVSKSEYLDIEKYQNR